MKMCAHGGPMKCMAGCYAEGGGVHEPNGLDRGSGVSMAGVHVRAMGAKSKMPSMSSLSHLERAREIHEKKLKELQNMPKPHMMAEGGEMHPMIHKIMAKRYSKGGMVANEDHEIADSEPNEFDDLALDDHLAFEGSAANEGDELGNAEKEHEEHELIAKIMKSRAKKDRNPRPA